VSNAASLQQPSCHVDSYMNIAVLTDNKHAA